MNAAAGPGAATIRCSPASAQNSLDDNPTLSVDIDEEKVGALGISQAQVDQTLTTAWGGNYVNDFVDRGRVKRVYRAGRRALPQPARRTSPTGTSAARQRRDGALLRLRPDQLGPGADDARPLQRRLQLRDPGRRRAGQEHRRGHGPHRRHRRQAARRRRSAWSGLSYQERLSGGQAPLLYAISLLVVFLCLAALYESWSVPFSVMLVIPLGLLGAALAVALRGLTNDVYFQVGLLTTMGLSAKNAILIVEFAEGAEQAGQQAATTRRWRPRACACGRS